VTPPGTGPVPLRALLRALPVFAGELPGFDPAAAPGSPVPLFTQWLLAAIDAKVPEPHAMAVSTADGRGRPSSRVLICKDVDENGCWYFAAQAASRKGRELAANPWAAVMFHWPVVGRQVRVSGPVTGAGAERSAADFRARGAAGRAEALTGRQSQVLGDPAELDAALAAARAQLAADPALAPAGWVLYALAAAEVEFWQAAEDRRHFRLRYTRTGTGWRQDRLWP
jgi:pyridoxamine 5'-phosphate oxidase